MKDSGNRFDGAGGTSEIVSITHGYAHRSHRSQFTILIRTNQEKCIAQTGSFPPNYFFERNGIAGMRQLALDRSALSPREYDAYAETLHLFEEWSNRNHLSIMSIYDWLSSAWDLDSSARSEVSSM